MSDAKTTPSPKLNTFVKLALTDPAFRRALLNAGGKTDTSQEWKDMSKQLTGIISILTFLQMRRF